MSDVYSRLWSKKIKKLGNIWTITEAAAGHSFPVPASPVSEKRERTDGFFSCVSAFETVWEGSQAFSPVAGRREADETELRAALYTWEAESSVSCIIPRQLLLLSLRLAHLIAHYKKRSCSSWRVTLTSVMWWASSPEAKGKPKKKRGLRRVANRPIHARCRSHLTNFLSSTYAARILFQIYFFFLFSGNFVHP